MNIILETALSWHDQGVTPLPIVPGTKRALVKWKHWQDRRPPRALIRAWFSKPCRLALMCGTGNLVVLDFDDLDLFQRWQHTHQYHYANSYRVSTSRPGMHVYFWCDELPEKSVSLVDVDIKATGYVLAPPSPGYSIVSGNPITQIANIEVLIPGLVKNLVATAERAENEEDRGCQNCLADVQAQPPSVPLSSFSAMFGSMAKNIRLAPGMVARIKNRLSILDLCDHYTKMEQGSNGYHWGRCPNPNHEDKNPSFSCSLKTGRATCWSSRCRLHRKDGMDVIDLVQAVEGCSDTDAMKVLALHLGLVKG